MELEESNPLFAFVDEETILEKIDELMPEALEWVLEMFYHCSNNESDG